MKRSESIAQLAAALAAAQGQIRTAPKDNVAKVRMKAGGEYSYKYTTLADIWSVCRKPLSDNGLSVIQIPTNDEGEGKIYLETIIAHSSGEWISGIMVIPIVVDRMSELQAMGSALTYARRYALAAMVGVTSGDDDDDGQSAPVSRPPLRVDPPAQKIMSLDETWKMLKKVERIGNFYPNPEAIQSCRSESSPLPDPSDIEGWRNLYADARDYALAEVARTVEGGGGGPSNIEAGQTELERQYPDILGAAAEDTGGK